MNSIVMEVINDLKNTNGTVDDRPVIIKSINNLNNVLTGYDRDEGNYKKLPFGIRWSGMDGQIDMMFRDFIFDSRRSFFKLDADYGDFHFELNHHFFEDDFKGRLFITEKKFPYRVEVFNGTQMDVSIRRAGQMFHTEDINLYKVAIMEKFIEVMIPKISQYISDIVQKQIINGITLYNYTPRSEAFPMTVNIFEEYFKTDEEIYTVCDSIYIPFTHKDGCVTVVVENINDLTFLLRALGENEINMDVLNFITRNEFGDEDFYLIKGEYLDKRNVFHLSFGSDYQSGYFLRDPENLFKEIYHTHKIWLGLEFSEYDGRYFHFTANNEVNCYQTAELFELQKFFLDNSLPVVVEEEFMESVYSKETKRTVRYIPLVFDGLQLSEITREKILSKYVD